MKHPPHLPTSYNTFMRNLIIFSLFLLLSQTTFGAGQMLFTQNDWLNQFHALILNPNVAYLLLLLAIYGILFELANPGGILPGAAGAIALLLTLYAFHLLPVNYLGIMLIILGIGFMIAEVYITSFGIIALGGAIAFIIGSILLFDTQGAREQLAWPLVFTMGAISFIFIFIVISLAIKSHKRKIVSGREGLIGKEGVVLSVMNTQITVRVLGEIWEAKSSRMLNEGDEIRVTGINGLILIIEPVEKKGK